MRRRGRIKKKKKKWKRRGMRRTNRKVEEKKEGGRRSRHFLRAFAHHSIQLRPPRLTHLTEYCPLGCTHHPKSD